MFEFGTFVLYLVI